MPASSFGALPAALRARSARELPASRAGVLHARLRDEKSWKATELSSAQLDKPLRYFVKHYLEAHERMTTRRRATSVSKKVDVLIGGDAVDARRPVKEFLRAADDDPLRIVLSHADLGPAVDESEVAEVADVVLSETSSNNTSMDTSVHSFGSADGAPAARDAPVLWGAGTTNGVPPPPPAAQRGAAPVFTPEPARSAQYQSRLSRARTANLSRASGGSGGSGASPHSPLLPMGLGSSSGGD